MLLFVVSYWPIAYWAPSYLPNHNETNYFQFAIADYHTSRQSGQTIDIYVRYAYKKTLAENAYPDYKLLRTDLLPYLEPSNELPTDVYWEIIASKMGKALMRKYPLAGISIQLHILDNNNSNKDEPGDHGSTFTMGEIRPLDVYRVSPK